MGRNNDIDKLIDAGLSRYSVGDLNGALVAWEQVLAIEPTNPQATSYVGYVRINHEALQSAAGTALTTDAASQFSMFAIDDSPQYVIGNSELDSASVVTEPVRRAPVRDSFGDDWFFEDDVALGTLQRSRTQSLDLSSAALAELSLQFALDEGEVSGTGEAISFESLTTEYSATPQVRDDAGTSNAANATSRARMSRPPQLEVRLRSPSASPEMQRGAQPTLDPSRENASLGSTDAANTAIERALQELAPLPDDAARATDDLISSLPIPRRTAGARGTEGPPLGAGDARHPTGQTSPGTADELRGLDVPDLLGGAPVIVEDVFVDPATGDAADDDDLPTRQSARATTARAVSRTRTGASTNPKLGSRTAPRADPIDACAAQILDEVDAEGGRIDEPKDDRIRRRVTALLARAAVWNKTDPDRAVCAVELALLEDPNSALAQKLIHRHREAIMAVFQSYLGNLERKPQLERPMHELESVSITPRAAFLLSRIDGELTLDEILDVSGMPRLEAYRHLSQLFLRKILG